MEGVAFQVRSALEYALSYGSPVLDIRASGWNMSGAWLQIISDVLGRPLMAMRDPQDAGARGAAACILVGLGHQRDFAFVQRDAAVETVYDRHGQPGMPMSGGTHGSGSSTNDSAGSRSRLTS